MKTIEKASEEYAKSLNLKGHDSFDFETYAKQDFKAGVEFAQRWISVDEELPKTELIVNGYEVSDIVIVKTKHNTYNILKLEKQGNVIMWFNSECQYIKGVTHWRPIELE